MITTSMFHEAQMHSGIDHHDFNIAPTQRNSTISCTQKIYRLERLSYNSLKDHKYKRNKAVMVELRLDEFPCSV